MLDVDKLVKVLSRTQSDHDGEALVAIRMANEMLKRAGLTWPDFARMHTSYYQTVPSRYGYYEDIEREAKAERERQRGEARKAERERRQTERDHYRPGNGRNDNVFNEWDDIWRSAEPPYTTILRAAGLDEIAIANFGLFHERQPEIAEWLWHHRDDDVITKLSWQGITKFPMRLGPLHLSILRRMMNDRT